MRSSCNEEFITTRSHKTWNVKEGCRIIATSFLSLLLPLSFLLLARLSTARYSKSIANDYSPQPQNNSLLIKNTTLILSSLVFFTIIATFANVFIGGKASVFNILMSQRVRFCGGWVLLFLMQICLCFGIFGESVDEEINGYTVGSLVVARRVFLVVGLYESMVLWWRSVVKPVVDETFCGEVLEKWVEKLVMMVGLGNLWWRRLREEAEVLVVLPWVMMELGMDVGVTDVLGWLLYYLTVAIGVVRVVKGLAWVLMGIFRSRSKV